MHIRPVGAVPVMGLLPLQWFLHVRAALFLMSNLRFFLLIQVFLIPVLAVQRTGGHGVAAGVDKGAACVEQLGHHQQHRQGNQQVQPDLINGIQDRRLFSQGQAQDGTDNDKRNQDQWPPIGRLLFSDYARMMVPSACLSFILIRCCSNNIFT